VDQPGNQYQLEEVRSGAPVPALSCETFMLAQHALNAQLGPVIRQYLARPFGRRTAHRTLLYYATNRISFSQAYPFLHYAADLKQRFGTEVRAVPIEGVLDGTPLTHSGADVVLVQPWFTVEPAALVRLMERLAEANPAASMAFLDSYAHSDLRLGRQVDDFVRYYVKKSRFRDPDLYRRKWRGGTNLTEHYSALYDIPATPVDWQTPDGLIDKLRLGPNFFTAPRFLSAFANVKPPSSSGRTIDLHARLGGKATGWYGLMRKAAFEALKPLGDLKVASQGEVPLTQFMRELAGSRLCFSPFGYGELCWRDVEAIQAGAVMIKPDMSHLETLPDLYEPDVTYLACRWDFADLEDVVRNALADEGRLEAIATEAWLRVSDYVRNRRFVTDMAFLFAPG
jgi:Glycosyl transferases group 1